MAKCSAITKEEQDQAEKFLKRSVMPGRDRCLFVLGIETGLRISALLSVKVDDVVDVQDSIKRVLVVRRAHVKGKKRSRRVALSPTARDVIYEALADMAKSGGTDRQRHLFAPRYKTRSITPRHAYIIISRALAAAGVTHTAGTHTLRKTRADRVAAWALRRHMDGHTTTLPVMAVKAALGHASLRTTEKYLQSGTEEVDAGTVAGEI